MVSEISPRNARAQKQVDALLEREGIRRDRNLDYTCGVYDDDGALIATGISFGNGSHELFINYQTDINLVKKGRNKHKSVRIL